MIRKLIAIGAALFALMFVAPAAQALHCENVSRPVDTSHARAVVVEGVVGTIYVQGNWVVLPFEPDTWIFVPPGTLTFIDQTVTPAGQTGNYMNGGAIALLDNMCAGHGLALDNRQHNHGIQVACGEPPA